MDSNHAVQLKQIYPHSHMSLYNSPVIGGAMPNLTLTSGLNLVNTTANHNGTNGVALSHDGAQLNALATLQASPNNTTTLTLPATAQLMPMTALNNIQLQQMQQHSFVDQSALRNSSNQHHQMGKTAGPTQFIQVQITNPLPTLVPSNLVQGSQNQAQQQQQQIANNNNHNGSVTTAASKKAPSMTDNSKLGSQQIKSSGVSNSSLPSQKKPAHGHSKPHTTSATANNLSDKYITINNGKGFKCLICFREFTQKGNLKTHCMTHLGPTERPYDCETCGKRFTQKGNRDIHVKIHTGTKDHSCPFCDRGFTQRGNLKTHIRSVHTGEKPFLCSECGKAFSQKANMLTHFKTHDKNSRFPCDACGKTFSQKGNLKTHQQRHVQATGM